MHAVVGQRGHRLAGLAEDVVHGFGGQGVFAVVLRLLLRLTGVQAAGVEGIGVVADPPGAAERAGGGALAFAAHGWPSVSGAPWKLADAL